MIDSVLGGGVGGVGGGGWGRWGMREQGKPFPFSRFLVRALIVVANASVYARVTHQRVGQKAPPPARLRTNASLIKKDFPVCILHFFI